jgi:hypothetical protein
MPANQMWANLLATASACKVLFSAPGLTAGAIYAQIETHPRSPLWKKLPILKSNAANGAPLLEPVSFPVSRIGVSESSYAGSTLFLWNLALSQRYASYDSSPQVGRLYEFPFHDGEHCRVVMADCGLEASGGNFNAGFDLLEDHIACNLTADLPRHLMYLRVENSQVFMDGVYLCERPIKQDYGPPADYVTVNGVSLLPLKDYTRLTLPNDYSIVEIGTMQGGNCSPQQKSVMRRGAFARCGLAADGNGESKWVCCLIAGLEFLFDGGGFITAAHALEFEYSPPPHSGAVGLLASSDGVNWMSGFSAPFAGRQAMLRRPVDHGALSQLSFYGGATSVTASNEPYAHQWPRDPEWTSWANSLLPGTFHAAVLRTASEKLEPREDVAGDAAIPLPVMGLRYKGVAGTDDSNATNWETYPVRNCTAQVACVQAHAPFVDPSAASEHSQYMPSPTQGNKFVFDGKPITGFKVKFTPHFNQTTPLATALIDEPAYSFTPDEYYYAGAATYQKETGFLDTQYYPQFFFWVTGGTPIKKPDEPDYQGAWVYDGTIYNLYGALPTFEMTNFPEGDVDEETEAMCIALEHSRHLHFHRMALAYDYDTRYTPNGLQVAGTALPFANENRLAVAPLTGEYDFTPFEVEGIPGASFLFRHSGEGEWSTEKQFEWSYVIPATTTTSEYVWRDWGNPPGYDQHVTGITNSHNVEVVEQWSLRCDHVEMYGELFSGLQEAGQRTNLPDSRTVRQIIENAHRLIDTPAGKSDTPHIAYTQGNEPRPYLCLGLYVRSVMRGESVMDVTPNIDSYPWSLSGHEGFVGTQCTGTSGSGEYDGADRTGGPVTSFWTGNSANPGSTGVPQPSRTPTVAGHHTFKRFVAAFSADQTEQLMGGQTVTATMWETESDGEENKPKLFVYGVGVRSYAVALTLNVS